MKAAAVVDSQLDANPAGNDAYNFPQNKRGRGKARRLVNQHSTDEAAPKAEMIELERERAELIRRNQEMLAKIGVNKAVSGLRQASAAPAAAAAAAARNGAPGAAARGAAAGGGGGGARQPVPRTKRARGEVEPVRRSGRLAGAAAAAAIVDVVEQEAAGNQPAGAARGVGIMNQEEYLASKGKQLPDGCFRSDGRFRGWVKGEVAERLGIAGSAAEAWEAGGGGKFVRKISKTDVPSQFKAKGWSDARAFAAGQMRKNPNSYFYRHTAPGEPQAQGEWTAEEHTRFVETARQYGVGDKWGLFASYIPNRVGYQCSAYYVQVIIPSGLILDDRYRMDAWGDAVFVGVRAGGRGDD